MKKIAIAVIFLLPIIFTGVTPAAVTTEELAQRTRQGQELFDALVLERNRTVDAIMADPSKSPRAREFAVKGVQENFLKQSREIHLKYREPFIQLVIAETNAQLPEGKKINATMGSDIYLRDKATGRVMRDTKGRKILNPKHRGMQGDLDLGGNPQAVKRLEGTFDQYKHLYLPEGTSPGSPSRSVVTSNSMDAPGYRDFGDVEVTINMTGEADLPGSSAHQTRVQMDAFSTETYVSASMRKNQAGRSLVETSDHIKKAAKGFAAPPADLLGWQGEKTLQGMSKGTLKSIDSGTVSDAQLSRVLEEAGYRGDVATFRNQLDKLKEGHLHQGVGLDEGNIEAFQRACRETTDQALDNARQQFDQHKTQVQARIETYEARIKSGELSGDQMERYRKVSERLRNELADSKVKIEETSLANRVKIEGGTYDDYHQKNALTNVKPIPAEPKMTRMRAVKEGLKPGLMDVAGYGVSAYNVYDNVNRMQRGEISQNDAVIGITTEVIDTGFGVVTDVGTAAAVGSIGAGAAGAVATVGMPLVVTAAAGYAVSKAVEEGLKTYEQFKVEEISKKIAKAKKEEAINGLQVQVNELLKAGEATGDWRFFAKADDIVGSLERMHQVTGDDDFRKTFAAVYDQITRKKDSLEAKYNCSIYALKGKMEEEKAAQAAREPKVLKIRASRILMGDQSGTYSITVPEGFEGPFTVRVAGGGLNVSKSSNPLRGRFRGTPSASDSTHTLSFLVKDVNGQSARGAATVRVRGLNPKTLASMNRPKQKLYAAPPPPRPAPKPQPAEDDGPDYNQKLAQIMNKYQQESQRITNEHNARMGEIKRQYRQKTARPPAPSWSSGGTTPQRSGTAGKSPRGVAEELVEVTKYLVTFHFEQTENSQTYAIVHTYARPLIGLGGIRFDRPFQLQGKRVYTAPGGITTLEKRFNKPGNRMTIQENQVRIRRSLIIE